MIEQSQTTSNVLLIRPSRFSFNEQTALSNAFQNRIAGADNEDIQKKASDEFDAFAEKLKYSGINVFIVDDTEMPPKPDAVFPNNWISFHNDGTVILYPMCTPNRRLERRNDIIEFLKKRFYVSNIIDLSFYEKQNIFLEGTGSVVFDHLNRSGYACISPRTDKNILEDLCSRIGYTPIFFNAFDKSGIQIYHTNVMMCIAEKFAVICLDAITGKDERKLITTSLVESGHEIVDISFEQMACFAGNMLALKNSKNESLLALSMSAFKSLTDEQKNIINKYSRPVPLSIENIETAGGGSARCMIAEIFLPEL